MKTQTKKANKIFFWKSNDKYIVQIDYEKSSEVFTVKYLKEIKELEEKYNIKTKEVD